MAKKTAQEKLNEMDLSKDSAASNSEFGLVNAGGAALKAGGSALGTLDKFERFPGLMALTKVYDLYDDHLMGDKYPPAFREEDYSKNHTYLPTLNEVMERTWGENNRIPFQSTVGFVGDIGLSFSNPVANAAKPFTYAAKGLSKGAKLAGKLSRNNKTAKKLLDYATNNPVTNNRTIKGAGKLVAAPVKYTARKAEDIIQNKPLQLKAWGGEKRKQVFRRVNLTLKHFRGMGENSFSNYLSKNGFYPRSLDETLDIVKMQSRKVLKEREKFVSKLPTLTDGSLIQFPNFKAKLEHIKRTTPKMSKDLIKQLENLNKSVEADLRAVTRGGDFAVSGRESFEAAGQAISNLGDYLKRNKDELLKAGDVAPYIKALYGDLRQVQRQYLQKAGGKKMVKKFDDMNKEIDLLVNARTGLTGEVLGSSTEEGLGAMGRSANELARTAQLGMNLGYFVVPSIKLGKDRTLKLANILEEAGPVVDPAVKRALIQSSSYFTKPEGVTNQTRFNNFEGSSSGGKKSAQELLDEMEL